MAIHCAAAEHGGLIKKEINKESSWVTFNAFPTNVGGLTRKGSNYDGQTEAGRRHASGSRLQLRYDLQGP